MLKRHQAGTLFSTLKFVEINYPELPINKQSRLYLFRLFYSKSNKNVEIIWRYYLHLPCFDSKET
jgi:hypothetical protein